MKKISAIVLFLSIMVLSCDTNDDDFYNTEYVRVNNLIQIETASNYTIGDFLYLNCNVSNLVTELGQTTPLDIRKTTDNAPSFVFSYVLERQTGIDEWTPVSVQNSQLNITAGSVDSAGFYLATATYNTSTNSYRFRAGIPLLSAGNYRLSYGYNSSATDLIELRSNSNPTAITLMIYTSSNAVNSSGYYQFTVN